MILSAWRRIAWVVAFSLLAPLPISAAATIDEVWLAPRADGIAGTGTEEDPFDASTAAKFDALFAGFVAGRISQPLAIHLSAGTFETAAGEDDEYQRQHWLGAGWRLTGAGMYATTIKNVNPDPCGVIMFTSTGYTWGPAGGCDGIVIADLTLDLQKNLFDAACIGSWTPVRVNGNGIRISNLRVIHCGMDAVEEHWSVWVGGGPDSHNVIENSLLEQCTGSTNAFAMFPGKKTTIRNCRADYTGTGASASGMNGFAFHAMTVTGCFSNGASAGWYGDTFEFDENQRLLVKDNVFVGNTWEGINVSPRFGTNVAVIGNRVRGSSADDAGIKITTLPPDAGAGVRRVLIAENDFEARLVFLQDTHEIVIARNITSGGVAISNVTDVYAFANRAVDGEPAGGLVAEREGDFDPLDAYALSETLFPPAETRRNAELWGAALSVCLSAKTETQLGTVKFLDSSRVQDGDGADTARVYASSLDGKMHLIDQARGDRPLW
ncbi:MAG: right-handed parallel beta-helix repeat-containing protein [Verrucomicrobiota bacterium]|nr:right-handed parallel beta-helix repeat-containing protein [Verrucomicrobiota bacterium]